MKDLKQAFTLIELLVVIAIIGVLTTVGVSNYMESRKKARDAQRIADLKAIREALEMYKQDQTLPSYPASLPSPCTSWSPYLKEVPGDPMGDGCSNAYYYSRDNNDSLKYTLAACMESKNTGRNVTSCPSGFTAPTGATCLKCYVLNEP